jgi:hypothetical protein
MVASIAFEIAQIEAAWSRHDASQAHAVCAFRTMRSFDGQKGRAGSIGMELRHVMHPCWIRRERKLSVTGSCRGRAVIPDPKMRYVREST